MAPLLEPEQHDEGQNVHRSPTQQDEPLSQFSRPTPRPPRSRAESDMIRIKNRRREYLERNPAYFQSAEHEFAGASPAVSNDWSNASVNRHRRDQPVFAPSLRRVCADLATDPLLYDELVRRFQTPAEREADGQAKGYGRVLEGSLLRGEARLAQLAQGSSASVGASTGLLPQDPPSQSLASDRLPGEVAIPGTDSLDMTTPPATKDEAAERWQEFLRARFVRGGDEEFDYAGVDENDEYDTSARKEEEDAWFEDEDPEWASSEGDEDRQETERQRQTRTERMLHGQTGIQDY